MADLVVIEHVTLDGVMQAPGRPDEDTRGGFTAGGWAAPYADPVAMEEAGKSMATSSALLLGRRTYLDFHSYWPRQTDGNPFTDVLNEAPKYVLTRTLTSLPWQNSTRLSGIDEVRALKSSEVSGDIVVLGSGELVRSLASLIDRLVLSTYPLALGTGQRLVFPPGAFRLTSSTATSTGVVISTYARTAA